MSVRSLRVFVMPHVASSGRSGLKHRPPGLPIGQNRSSRTCSLEGNRAPCTLLWQGGSRPGDCPFRSPARRLQSGEMWRHARNVLHGSLTVVRGRHWHPLASLIFASAAGASLPCCFLMAPRATCRFSASPRSGQFASRARGTYEHTSFALQRFVSLLRWHVMWSIKWSSLKAGPRPFDPGSSP